MAKGRRCGEYRAVPDRVDRGDAGAKAAFLFQYPQIAVSQGVSADDEK